MKPKLETRLDSLREEARSHGVVSGRGLPVNGGPIPRMRQPRPPGYAGEPVIRPPVWTWEIPVYFFVGGMAGMAAIIGCASWIFGRADIARAAFWLAAFGGVVSPILLTMDLGRPKRFLNMLRVFKIRSPMSVGAWIVSAFSAHAVPGAIAFELLSRPLFTGGPRTALFIITILLAAGAGFFGMFLSTYTGVLIGATVVPAWFLHHKTLPVHFGAVGLGSAVAFLELLGYRAGALTVIAFFACGVETILWLQLERSRHGRADSAVHKGRSGWMVRVADLCTGPLAMVFRLLGWIPVSAISFTAGGLLSRFAWLEAGRVSAKDPESVFASQSPARPKS